MSDYRDLLERERRRFRMPHGSMQELERRRDRRRRNRRIASGIVALIVAAVGIGAGLYALRPTGSIKPVVSPTPSVTPPVSHSLLAPSGPIQFVDAGRGWAAFQGKVYRTEDGGHTWSPADTGNATVSSIDFVDSRHGWAITDRGLLATGDGGLNWDLASHVGLESVQFTSLDRAWGITEPRGQGRLVSSTDGGRTWQVQKSGIAAVCFADPLNGWAAAGTTVLRTTDGGQKWAGGPLPDLSQGEPWTATLRCGGSDAWVLSQDGGAAGHQAYAAFGTADGGTSWTPILQEDGTSPLGRNRKGVYSEPDPYSGPFAATGSGSAVFVNYCPPCFGSEGATVTATLVAGDPPAVTDHIDFLEPGLAAIPTGLSFVEGGKGWLLLEDSSGSRSLMHVIGTTDGGKTWTGLCRGPTCSSS